GARARARARLRGPALRPPGGRGERGRVAAPPAPRRVRPVVRALGQPARGPHSAGGRERARGGARPRLPPRDRRHRRWRRHDPDRRDRGRRRPRRGATTAFLHGGLMTKRAVLAYSGGLDTSVTVRWLTDQGYEVHAVVVDVGQHEDFDSARARGDTAGAAEVRVVRAADRFAEEFVAPAIKANALYEGK